MQYFHINKEGEIVDWHNCLANAHKAERLYDRSNCQLIDEEEKLYRKVAWCTENGFDIDDVLEDEDGEFVFEEIHNYGHPTDDGAVVETKKVYLTYKEVKPSLNEVVNLYI